MGYKFSHWYKTYESKYMMAFDLKSARSRGYVGIGLNIINKHILITFDQTFYPPDEWTGKREEPSDSEMSEIYEEYNKKFRKLIMVLFSFDYNREISKAI